MPADTDIPKYAIAPHILPIATLILLIVFDLLLPVPYLPKTVSLAVGIPAFVLGLGLWLWGVAGLLSRGESPNPEKSTAALVTSGPYRFSRNPIYTGGVLGLFGLAFLLNTATGTAIVVALALMVHNVVAAEERYLDVKFGTQWRDYCAAVRRWI